MMEEKEDKQEYEDKKLENYEIKESFIQEL